MINPNIVLDDLIKYCCVASPWVSPLTRGRQLGIIRQFIRKYRNDERYISLMEDAIRFMYSKKLPDTEIFYKESWRTDWDKVDDIIKDLYDIIKVDVDVFIGKNNGFIIDGRFYNNHFIQSYCNMTASVLSNILLAGLVQDNPDNSRTSFKYRLVQIIVGKDKEKAKKAADIFKKVYPVFNYNRSEVSEFSLEQNISICSDWTITRMSYFDGTSYIPVKEAEKATLFDLEMIPRGGVLVDNETLLDALNKSIDTLYTRALIDCMWLSEYANTRKGVKANEVLNKLNHIRKYYYICQNIMIDNMGHLNVKVARRLSNEVVK